MLYRQEVPREAPAWGWESVEVLSNEQLKKFLQSMWEPRLFKDVSYVHRWAGFH